MYTHNNNHQITLLVYHVFLINGASFDHTEHTNRQHLHAHKTSLNIVVLFSQVFILISLFFTNNHNCSSLVFNTFRYTKVIENEYVVCAFIYYIPITYMDILNNWNEPFRAIVKLWRRNPLIQQQQQQNILFRFNIIYTYYIILNVYSN